MSLSKNYKNWPLFHGVIQKTKVARFLLTQGLDLAIETTESFHSTQHTGTQRSQQTQRK